MQFPFPDPVDQWVEEGYRFDSLSNYRWARRELVLLIRYAIGETQLKFPGTRPLGLGDMSQRDGLTPGFDLGQPRHPESAHDQGASIDQLAQAADGLPGGAVLSLVRLGPRAVAPDRWRQLADS